MNRTHCRAHGPLIACIASVALLPVGTVARAQERTAQSIVDGVVNAVCQKQIVLLGELPTHGEAHTFDAKSKIADRLIAQCGFTAILFEAADLRFHRIGARRGNAHRHAGAAGQRHRSILVDARADTVAPRAVRGRDAATGGGGRTRRSSEHHLSLRPVRHCRLA